jgi:nitroimidazol reductase NimA-like FMN-containing flavoprotein (pyridoxamine 5'-phosphate oxidase superfamily)
VEAKQAKRGSGKYRSVKTDGQFRSLSRTNGKSGSWKKRDTQVSQLAAAKRTAVVGKATKRLKTDVTVDLPRARRSK